MWLARIEPLPVSNYTRKGMVPTMKPPLKPVRKGEAMIITHLCLRHGAHTSLIYKFTTSVCL